MPPRSPSAHEAPRERAVARFRLRVTRGESVAVGPGKVALLEAVARTGSITAAAKDLGMSYPRAWNLVHELNRALRQPAVASEKGGERGGRRVLTPMGRQLVETYRRIERKAASASRAELASLITLLR